MIDTFSKSQKIIPVSHRQQEDSLNVIEKYSKSSRILKPNRKIQPR